MTWDNASELTQRIRYLQEWTPPSQRHRAERSRSPYRNAKGFAEIHKALAEGRKSLGDLYAIPNWREEIATFKRRIELLSGENSSLRKSRKELEANLNQAKKELAESEAKVADSEFEATEAKARVNALDHDVEKLCELSKLLTHENATLQMRQLKERELELKALKAQMAVQQEKESETLSKFKEQNEELTKTIELVNTIQAENEELRKELETLCAYKADQKEKLERAVERLNTYDLENGALRREIDRLHRFEAEREELQKAVERLENVGTEKEALLNRLNDADIARTAEVQRLSRAQAEEAAALEVAEIQVERLTHELKKVSQELGEAQKLIHEWNEERERLQATWASEKQTREAEVEQARGEAESLREERARLVAERSEAERRQAELEEQVAEMEEAMAEYEGELKHLSEDVERASEDAAAQKARAEKLEEEAKEARGRLAAAGGGRRWSASDVDVAQLSRRLSSVLFYRESSTDADRLVQLEFEKMTAAFSRGLIQVEMEIGEWKEKVEALEAALRLAKDSAVSSERTAAVLVSELTAVTEVLKRPTPPRLAQSPAGMALPPRKRSSAAIVPATVASGALAGGLYAAVKLLKVNRPVS